LDFDRISADVKQFIISHINSIEQLEILLLLAETRRAWSVVELADKICTTPDSARNRIDALQKAGLVSIAAVNPPSYVFQPATRELADAVTHLSQEYRERRISIVNLIYSQPIQNIRTISDAFRLRPPEKE
jgi:predicted ArsR family transcriptional regulator